MLAREQSPFALIQTDDAEGILCLVADAFCALGHQNFEPPNRLVGAVGVNRGH